MFLFKKGLVLQSRREFTYFIETLAMRNGSDVDYMSSIWEVSILYNESVDDRPGWMNDAIFEGLHELTEELNRLGQREDSLEFFQEDAYVTSDIWNDAKSKARTLADRLAGK